MEFQERIQDKCRGAIVGGAIGDTLGYEVEFMNLQSILAKFGEKGITRYVLDNGVAHFSDDTQMSLFTAEGLLNGCGVPIEDADPKKIYPHIVTAYLNWYKTQTEPVAPQPDSWLSHIKALWASRAPGNTCMSAMWNIQNGIEVCNNSKGCGGVMRVAPIGVYYGARPYTYNPKDWMNLARWAAEITHCHQSSSLASMMLAFLVESCVGSAISDEEFTKDDFINGIYQGLWLMQGYIPNVDFQIMNEFDALMRKSIDLAESDIDERAAIRQLGEGWVGDEAIAIAAFSVIRHFDNFEDCIICAVNHDGDSDSTGAIAGNLIGAIHGLSAIPRYYTDSLEIYSILISVADDLCARTCEEDAKERLVKRYVEHQPAEVDNQFLI